MSFAVPACDTSRQSMLHSLATERTHRSPMALSTLVLHRSSGSPWRPLETELDAWAECGRIARFWWRDDDAVAPSRALNRLLALAGSTPLTLAVIPLGTGPDLARRLADAGVTVVQHGIAHDNHAPSGQKRAELGGHVPLEATARALTDAHAYLADLFGGQLLPVLVPPWNRIAPDLIPLLPGAGFAGPSAFGPRQQRLAAPGLVQVNTHADPVDWTMRFCRPVAEIATGLAGQLAARRLGLTDAGEPVGLLTHHRLDDRGIEAVVADLAALLAGHPAARWVGLAEALAA
jgi:hypothetical protein